MLGVYDNPDNIHFKFGNAFGSAAAAIVENYSDPYELRLGKALMQVASNLDISLPFKGKTFVNMVAMLKALNRAWEQWHTSGYRFVSSETKYNLTVWDDDKSKVWLKFNGTLDLLLYNSVTNLYTVLDFKSTQNDYYNTWEYEPQVELYTLLSKIANPTYNFGEPCYLVAQFLETDLTLDVTFVDQGLKYQLPSVVALAKRMYDDCTELDISSHRDYPVSTTSCRKGNYRCNYTSICYTSSNPIPVIKSDSRRPTSVVTLDLTKSQFYDILYSYSKPPEDITFSGGFNFG